MTLGWVGSGGIRGSYLRLLERACVRIVVNRRGTRREAGPGGPRQGVEDDLARAPGDPGQGGGAAVAGQAGHLAGGVGRARPDQHVGDAQAPHRVVDIGLGRRPGGEGGQLGVEQQGRGVGAVDDGVGRQDRGQGPLVLLAAAAAGQGPVQVGGDPGDGHGQPQGDPGHGRPPAGQGGHRRQPEPGQHGQPGQGRDHVAVGGGVVAGQVVAGGHGQPQPDPPQGPHDQSVAGGRAQPGPAADQGGQPQGRGQQQGQAAAQGPVGVGQVAPDPSGDRGRVAQVLDRGPDPHRGGQPVPVGQGDRGQPGGPGQDQGPEAGQAHGQGPAVAAGRGRDQDHPHQHQPGQQGVGLDRDGRRDQQPEPGPGGRRGPLGRPGGQDQGPGQQGDYDRLDQGQAAVLEDQIRPAEGGRGQQGGRAAERPSQPEGDHQHGRGGGGHGQGPAGGQAGPGDGEGGRGQGAVGAVGQAAVDVAGGEPAAQDPLAGVGQVEALVGPGGVAGRQPGRGVVAGEGGEQPQHQDGQQQPGQDVGRRLRPVPAGAGGGAHWGTPSGFPKPLRLTRRAGRAGGGWPRPWPAGARGGSWP